MGSLCLLFICGACPVPAEQGATLARVRARGVLWCGIDRSEAEYSNTDEHGSRRRFDLDLCRAVAVAALGPGAAVKAVFYADDVTSMEALASGKADVVATLSADATHRAWHRGEVQLGWSGAVLDDTVGLLVPHDNGVGSNTSTGIRTSISSNSSKDSSGVRRAADLSGKKICFLTETHTEERLHAWFAERHLDLLPFPFQEEGEMEAAFFTGNCAALAGDLTRLAETRADMGTRAHEYTLLPDSLGEDTLALAYRDDDAAWKQLVDGTRDILLHGRSAGRGASAAAGEKNAAFINGSAGGETPATPAPLSAARASDIIAAVGDYRTLFDRDLGADSPLNLPLRASVLKLDTSVLPHPRPDQ